MAHDSVSTPAENTRYARYWAIGLMAAVALLWNVVEGIGVLLTHQYSLYQVVATRYGVHLLLMLLLVVPRHGAGILRTRAPGLQLLQGAMMTLMPLCFILAIEWMPARQVFDLTWLAPVFVLLAARLLLNERPRPWLYATCALGSLGVLLALRMGALQWSPGLLLALGMVVAFALYIVLARRLRAEPAMTNLFYTALCVFLPFTVLAAPVWVMPTLRDFAIMATIGVAGFLLLWGLHRAAELSPASELAPWLLLAPLVTWILQSLAAHSLNGRLAAAGAAVTLLTLGAALLLKPALEQPARPAR